MTSKYERVIDLIDDPICAILMRRDGVNPTDLLQMMMAIKPVVAHQALARQCAGREMIV